MSNDRLRQVIRARYDAIARGYAQGAQNGCGFGESGGQAADRPACRSGCCPPVPGGQGQSSSIVGLEMRESGLGCARIADLVSVFPGETLLDVGSGPGLETMALARLVEPALAFGLDLAPAMVEVASENARKAGVTNVRFLSGLMEDIPLEDAAVDIVVSNCVVNLSLDKQKTMNEIGRVLRPGGRVAIADIVWLGSPPERLRDDASAWASCVGGALEVEEYPQLLRRAGFGDVKLEVLQGSAFTELSCCVPQDRSAGAEQKQKDQPQDGVDPCSRAAIVSALVTARKLGAPEDGVEIRGAQPGELDLALRILRAAGLPTAGVEEHLADFLVARGTEGKVVGLAGLEVYPSAALLRSVVVLPSWRGQGLGRRLVERQLARLSPGTPVYLLTATAEAYFRSIGFETVSRDEVHSEVQASAEFAGACPKSAAIMRKVRR